MRLKGLDDETAELMRAWFSSVSETYGLSDLERSLFEHSVIRVTMNEIRREAATSKDAEWIVGLAMNNAHHFIEWLRTSINEDAPWLRNADEKGRPKKIMRFSTLEDVAHEVDRMRARKVSVA